MSIRLGGANHPIRPSGTFCFFLNAEFFYFFKAIFYLARLVIYEPVLKGLLESYALLKLLYPHAPLRPNCLNAVLIMLNRMLARPRVTFIK